MFRQYQTDEQLRAQSNKLMAQADSSDCCMDKANELLKEAVKLRHLLANTTHDDRRKQAECLETIALNIKAMHDQSSDDEFESRTPHREFYFSLKHAIFAIDNIPFDQQTDEDLGNVLCWYSDIMTNYYYFRIPDEVVMDDHFLNATSKYLAKETALEVKAKLEQLVKEQSACETQPSFCKP